MATPAELAADWRSLADLDPAAQIEAMRAKQAELLKHPEAQIASEIENIIVAEVDSDDATMASLTRNRLLSWLQMDADDVARLSTAVEAARETMAGPQAMRSTMAVQAAFRSLEHDEVRRLVTMGPLLRKAVSSEELDMLEALDTVSSDATAAVAPAAASMRSRKPWWKFW